MRYPQTRASDADRERVVAALQEHAGAGRLTLDEFSDLASAAYRASTLGDLGALTSDLPATGVDTADEPGAPRSAFGPGRNCRRGPAARSHSSGPVRPDRRSRPAAPYG